MESKVTSFLIHSFHSPVLGSSEELKQFGLFCPTITLMLLSGLQKVYQVRAQFSMMPVTKRKG